MGRHNQAKGQENGRSLRQTPRETEEEEGGMHRSDPKGRTHLCLGKRAEERRSLGTFTPAGPAVHTEYRSGFWALGSDKIRVSIQLLHCAAM